MRTLGKIARALLVLAMIGVVVVLAIIFVPPQRTPAQAQTAADEIVVAVDGEYAMRLGDCAACHTAEGGAPFAGGYGIESPLGTIYSSNITPDPEHGIGTWTLDEFRGALYDGIDDEGHRLYPAMPSANYRMLSEADVESLYDYFMNEVEPVAEDPPETDLAFPFNQRWGLRVWQWVAYDDAGFEARYDDPVLNRGAYLVEGPGHCGACHSPRTVVYTQNGYTPADEDFLSGGEIAGWAAPSLRGPQSAPALWEEDQMVAFLRSGRNAHTGVAGEMSLVVEESLQFMTEEDVTAIARYLRHVVSGDTGETAAPEDAAAQIEATTALLRSADPDMDLGPRLYLDNCNACHFVDGMGADEVFPELVGNSTVLADQTGGFLNVILTGAALPSTETRPMRLRMPGFADRLSDAEVATLATFVRQAWSNDASAIASGDVADARERIDETGAAETE